MGRTDENLIPPDTPWLTDPAARAVCAALQAEGHHLYFVGGCVRNALLGRPVSDVDMSTNARPEEVTRLAEAAGLKAVPTGIDHGTVTVVSDGHPFEITTFRRDVETDGRRAVVAYSDDIADDARRRDFTMNALYATPAGEIVDPLGGLPDLRARRVRFIEDPAARIREDYLRILRFFRFTATYGDPALGFDAEALAAIAANLDGLETLSAERLGHEMTRLLTAPEPAPAVAAMRQVGALGRVLPGSDDRWLGPLVHLEQEVGIPADWRARLAILGGEDVAVWLRLSKADGRMLEKLTAHGFGATTLAEIAYREGVEVAQQTLLIRGAVAAEIPQKCFLDTITDAAKAEFPIRAADLMPRYKGPALGEKLRALEADWIASGFALTAQELIDRA
ncbi:MAG: CCA tRNA nucleotidyltransferase [Sulfitobacter sp.]|nr:CCA tRNA nucleotidyltransferase [Sulfitobacter sp.]